eukprot:10152913-Lingulodinium_polyedra.AAC.1
MASDEPRKGGRTTRQNAQRSTMPRGQRDRHFRAVRDRKGHLENKSHGRIMGYFVVYVDDVLIFAPTNWVKAVMNTFAPM